MFYRIEDVWKWGEDRGLYERSTFEAQVVKLVEEAGELLKAINANDNEEVKDAIGDCMVVIGHLVKFSHGVISPADPIESVNTSAFALWCGFLTCVSLTSESRSSVYFRETINCLCQIAMSFGLTLNECMDHVIPIINARTGKFNEHGLYVKDPQPVAESSLAGNVISVK